MFINNFDPVAFELFSFQIRWYSLSYIFGILLGWIYCKRIINDKIFEKVFDDLIGVIIIGIILVEDWGMLCSIIQVTILIIQ